MAPADSWVKVNTTTLYKQPLIKKAFACKQLRRFMREYKKMNPRQSKQDFDDIAQDMRTLIEKKTSLFPGVDVQILDRGYLSTTPH